MVDVVVTCSPDGRKIRSKPELVRALGSNYDAGCFDFRSGKILQSAIRKSKRMKGTTYDYARGLSLFLCHIGTGKLVMYGSD